MGHLPSGCHARAPHPSWSPTRSQWFQLYKRKDHRHFYYDMAARTELQRKPNITSESHDGSWKNSISLCLHINSAAFHQTSEKCWPGLESICRWRLWHPSEERQLPTSSLTHTWLHPLRIYFPYLPFFSFRKMSLHFPPVSLRMGKHVYHQRKGSVSCEAQACVAALQEVFKGWVGW